MTFVIGTPVLILLIGLTASTGNPYIAALTLIVGVALILYAAAKMAEADNEPH